MDGARQGKGKRNAASCCRVEAVVAVDERGQMVLPKEVRRKAGVGPGSKLALALWEKDGAVCCILLTPVEHLDLPLGSFLGEGEPKKEAKR